MVARSGYASIGTASTQTLLAKGLAPPRTRRVFPEAVGIFVVTLWLEALLHSKVLLVLLWLPASVYAAWALKRNREAKVARRHWQRKFVCMRCGHIFIPGASGTGHEACV